MMESRLELVVFSDDWGRHPSSCQHLIRHLLPRYPALWVNTIGTRSPRLTAEDLGKALAKLRTWTAPATGDETKLPPQLRVISPRMWPGFRQPWQRRFNRRSISRAVDQALGPRRPGQQRIAITTLPIVADVVGRIDAQRWVYYCVDDFSVWPGLDAQVMREMEAELVGKVDALVAVSDHLADHLTRLRQGEATSDVAPAVSLLTHGIDLEHWLPPSAQTPQPGQNAAQATADRLPHWLADLPRPIVLFWGLIDRRLDLPWLQALSGGLAGEHSGGGGGSIVLVGPTQDPDPCLASLPRVVMPGPAAYADLPALARAASVLVMPYADLPVTRAMNPLKFKEYLATYQPVVARRLPATAAWADAADLLECPHAFTQAVIQRIREGLPESQRLSRQRRLPGESWGHKARQFEAVMIGGGSG